MRSNVADRIAEQLNDRVIDLIANATRRGTWDWIAAQQAGLGYPTFLRIMAFGKVAELEIEVGLSREEAIEASGCRWPLMSTRTWEQVRDVYYRFYRLVSTAKAEARGQAESTVWQTDPLSWLRRGPGRERPGEPGWGDSLAVTQTTKEELEIEVVDYREAVGVLEPAPDAGNKDVGKQ